MRRYKLALQYYIKLISCPQNPAYNCIMETRYKNLFENKEKVIKPFNLRIQTLLNEIKINPKIISRLRIGHIHITHSHFLKGEDFPVCLTCKLPLTVKHILINFDRFRQIHPKYYQTNNLKNLFKNSKPEKILSFLKEINLFIKI